MTALERNELQNFYWERKLKVDQNEEIAPEWPDPRGIRN